MHVSTSIEKNKIQKEKIGKNEQTVHKGRNSNEEHMNTCLNSTTTRPIQFKVNFKNKSNNNKSNIKSPTN